MPENSCHTTVPTSSKQRQSCCLKRNPTKLTLRKYQILTSVATGSMSCRKKKCLLKVINLSMIPAITLGGPVTQRRACDSNHLLGFILLRRGHFLLAHHYHPAFSQQFGQ